MDKKTIYIADSEVNICNTAKPVLEKEGFNVVSFNNGLSTLQAFDSRPADMLILDAVLPEIDGFTLCSAIRKKSSAPIIIVSAKATEQDKLTGLSSGSDDYLTKPFSPIELIARIKSIFRRMDLDRVQAEHDRTINIANIILKLDSKQAIINNLDIGLTVMEFNLLSYLTENKNRAVSREELLRRIWGFESIVETRATDDMIKRIRKKLVIAGSGIKIVTIWGFGFKIEA